MSKVAAGAMAMVVAVLACAGCSTGLAGWVCDGVDVTVGGGGGDGVESDPVYATGGVARAELMVSGNTTSRWDAATQVLSIFGDGGGDVGAESDPVYATGGVARAGLTVSGNTTSRWDAATQVLSIFGDGGGEGGGAGGLTNGAAVAVLGGMTLSNRQVVAEESAGGVTGRANVWQAAPVATPASWTAVSNGATYVAVVTTQTVVTAAVTGTVEVLESLAVTAIHDANASWQMPPYYLLADGEAMWREEGNGEAFFLYWEDMAGCYVLVMSDMNYCAYSNLTLEGTYGPWGMTMATGTVVVAGGGMTTNDLVGFTETAECVTNLYPIARHLRDGDLGFCPVFAVDVTSTMETESDGSRSAFDFVLQASTDGFATVCYVYASFGISASEQALYGEGRWYEEAGADFGGLCLTLPVTMSVFGPVQKAFEESLAEMGLGYMSGHLASPTLFMPATRAAWMAPGNTELLWRVRRFNEEGYVEKCWRMIRPTEWRVAPIGGGAWKRFGGWTE